MSAARCQAVVDEMPVAESDESLMLQVRAGHVGKMAELFERHHRPVFNYFYRVTGNPSLAEDLVQDVFLRMLKYRDSYQPRTSFPAWMYQVAKNAHIDAIRKRRLETFWKEDAPEPRSSEVPAEERLAAEQDTVLLRQALASLPADKREVLVLSRYQNLKYEEIGQVLGCDANAVKQRVFRAVRALGDKYSELVRRK
ncbi:MAG: RNA polymerase sigma factor [Bryobacteraceae bacterium]